MALGIPNIHPLLADLLLPIVPVERSQTTLSEGDGWKTLMHSVKFSYSVVFPVAKCLPCDPE